MINKILYKIGLFALLLIIGVLINTVKVDAASKISMKNRYTSQYKLSNSQRDFWNQTLKEYKKGKKGIVDIYTKMTRKETERIVYNPEILSGLFYTDALIFPCTYGIKTDGSGIVMHVNMNDLKKAINSSSFNQKKINKIIRKLKLSRKTSQMDAVKKINNYLIKTISYDYSCKRYRLSDALKGSTTCSGYARAFCAIGKTVGLDARYVAGTGITSTQRGFHAWNSVKIGNSTKYLDICWNDSTKNSTKYLLISKKQISKNHKSKPSNNKNIIYKYI